MKAPTTHVSWARPKRANDRPRLASGVRCTTESKASLPLLGGPTPAGPTLAAATMPRPPPSTAPPAVRPRTICRMRSSLVPDRRSAGASSEPEQRADAAGRHRHAELGRVASLGAQGERDEERREADDAPHQAHRRGGEDDAAAPQLLALGLGRVIDRHLGGRHPHAQHRGHREHDDRQHQHAPAAGDQEGEAARRRGREGDDAGQERQASWPRPARRPSSPRWARWPTWRRGSSWPAQHGEGLGEQQQPVDVADHQHADDRPRRQPR